MSILYLILLFLIVIGMTWWLGSWNIMINLVNFFIASLVASSFFEPLANVFESINNTFVHVVDFVAIWTLFVATFLILRLATDFLTKYQMQMNIWAEYSIRSVLSIWLACGFVCFTCFTLHLAPLPPDQFQYSPQEKLFGIGPDQMWMAFVQSRSRGALAESKDAPFLPDYNLLDHPDDVDLKARVFDPHAGFGKNGSLRRTAVSKSETLRVIQ